MELCGDMVQDFCGNFLKMNELESTCSFPLEMKNLDGILGLI